MASFLDESRPAKPAIPPARLQYLFRWAVYEQSCAVCITAARANSCGTPVRRREKRMPTNNPTGITQQRGPAIAEVMGDRNPIARMAPLEGATSIVTEDDPRFRGPADRSRIHVENEMEVRWWCVQFNCSEVRLRQAVTKVGRIPESVRRELRK